MSNRKTYNFTGFNYSNPQKSSSDRKFNFKMNSVPPPPSLTGNSRGGQGHHSSFNLEKKPELSKYGYATMDSMADDVSAQTQSYHISSRKRAMTEDEAYFDEDDEAQSSKLEYIPAEGSPGHDGGTGPTSDDDEEDPLDAFMAGLEKQTKQETVKVDTKAAPKDKGVRADIDDEDDEESYYRYMEENPTAGLADENSGDELEYDEDGNPIAPNRKKFIDPLPPIDHSEFEYKPFEKNFYVIHEEISALSRNQINDLRHKLGIKVTGPQAPSPIVSFAHFNFDEGLMKSIRKSEYTQPTPIQAQSIPAALSGRDLIGIAKTGSGKTAAYLWPLLVHIMDQPELQEGEGPVGLILAPTRELAIQIFNEAKKFGKIYNIRVVCCYGGGNKWEQSKALEQGAEIVVATPGRMIDMIKMKATNFIRCSYLVLDEADRMFNMGFEPQVRSICNHVQPGRQTLLFSATFKKRIEKLARDVLTDPIRIVQGDIGEANQDITQHVLVFSNPNHKWNWLLTKLVELLSEGSVLIFATKKADADQLAESLMLKEYPCLLLHGDIEQAERNKRITQFKRKEFDILVATDVAARGLDIPHIKNVINYDMARDIDTHTHRIGRTARAGEKGTAYTLVTDKDKEMVGHLVRNLEGANQHVPDDLMELAMQSSWFRKSRFKTGKGKPVSNIGGVGLGFRERKGFEGSSGSGSSALSKAFVSASSSYASSTSSATPSASSSSQGPTRSTDRLSALKEAFKMQYNSQFRVSTDKTWEKTIPTEGVFQKPALPPPPPSFGNNSNNSNNSDNDSGTKKTKKSRWN